ncbi:alpha/beta hydrolase [Thalassotalea sp. PP2-459]|uniref:alpha/beta hydrolase n=1 Tax=Thalassotalea sp. PP2-459 TaxID=1742724 RepID=UPI00094401CD|nr:alpha/beta hydrolase [Thalassotalea sp. PP2-459]OKY27814.1 hypothetical protein BI291_07835 [Thalassotalea sp. PP2-459]
MIYPIKAKFKKLIYMHATIWVGMLSFNTSATSIYEFNIEDYKSAPVISIDSSVDASFYRDIPYGDNEFAKLDLFRVNDLDNAPVVLYLHGGSFIGGDKSSSKIQADVNQFLKAGVNFIAVNYSLLDVDRIDSTGIRKSLNDVAHAIQYIRSNATQFSIDKQRVAIYGESTGANLALWVGLSDDLANNQSTNLIERESTTVSAIAAIEAQGSLDFLQWENLIFAPYGFKLDLLAQNDFSWYLASYYGLDNTNLDQVLSILRDGQSDILTYRAFIDILNKLDPLDPPVFISNTRAPVDLQETLNQGDLQKTLYSLFHHQLHVATFVERAIQAGIVVDAHAPEVGIYKESTNEIEFLINKLIHQ